MRVKLLVILGSKVASKTVELPFVPVPNMSFYLGDINSFTFVKAKEVTYDFIDSELEVELEAETSEMLEMLESIIHWDGWTIEGPYISPS